MSASTETTAAELPPVQSTDTTFPELPPAPALPAAITQPVKSRKDHPVVPPADATAVGPSDAALPALPALAQAPKSRKDHAVVAKATDTVVGASDAALAPLAPDTAAELPKVPSAIAKRETVISSSDAALPPLQAPLPDQPRVPPDVAAQRTTEQDPDPRAFFRLWLVIPRFRTQRRIAASVTAVLLLGFGMLLGSSTGGADPGRARPVARGPKPEASEPKEPLVLDAPKALQTAAPIFVERAVDAGAGTTRMEKVEAGMIKIHSVPDTEVVMNGQRLGTVPVFITAPVGKIDFVLESRDAGIYKPVALPLYSGKNPGRMFELGRGWLEVVAPRGSQIWVDGRAAGAAPIQQLELWEGFHRVDVVRPDKTRVTRSVEVVARFTTTHEVTH